MANSNLISHDRSGTVKNAHIQCVGTFLGPRLRNIASELLKGNNRHKNYPTMWQFSRLAYKRNCHFSKQFGLFDIQYKNIFTEERCLKSVNVHSPLLKCQCHGWTMAAPLLCCLVWWVAVHHVASFCSKQVLQPHRSSSHRGRKFALNLQIPSGKEYGVKSKVGLLTWYNLPPTNL